MMFLLGYINQPFTVFFVLNDVLKVCELHDLILLLSQCMKHPEQVNSHCNGLAPFVQLGPLRFLKSTL